MKKQADPQSQLLNASLLINDKVIGGIQDITIDVKVDYEDNRERTFVTVSRYLFANTLLEYKDKNLDIAIKFSNGTSESKYVLSLAFLSSWKLSSQNPFLELAEFTTNVPIKAEIK